MSDTHPSSYQQEWSDLFCGRFYLEQLRSAGVKGALRDSNFRSICWKLFLDCIPEDRNLWIDATKSQRQRYEEILDKFHTNPWMNEGNFLDVNVNNPLSQSHQSPWNQYFQDTELKITIQQDVVRTFPEIDFFRTPKVQEMMTRILFSYAREFPHVSYKQGMHELLAPVIYVLHNDQQACLQKSKTESLDLDIHILLNQNYIEHDAFFLFCQIMGVVEDWYSISEFSYAKEMSLVSKEPFTEFTSDQTNTLGLKLKKIYEHLLKHNDVDLFSYLEEMEITPQIYGIRWLRLLFGREFAIKDLLIIWDAIFADSISFDLVNYIFVAMLTLIRDLLLKSDYASCLRHLMHYPNIADVHCIIDLALYLRDPGGNVRPDGCTIQASPTQYSKMVRNGKSTAAKGSFPKISLLPPGKSLSVIPSLSSKGYNGSYKHANSRPKTLKISGFHMSSAHEVPISGLSLRTESEKQAKTSSCEKQFSRELLDHNSSEWNTSEADSSNIEIGVGVSYTLPRATIRNVMENTNHEFRALDLRQSFGQYEDKKSIPPETSLCREMVPLVPALAVRHSYNIEQSMKSMKIYKSNMKDKSETVKILKNEIMDLRLMNEYCAQKITQHIEKLQERMMCQRLLYEDEMFIALAGLKRARDILKGTVAFTEEVMNDDHFSISTNSCNKAPNCNSSTFQEDVSRDSNFMVDASVKLAMNIHTKSQETMCTSLGKSQGLSLENYASEESSISSCLKQTELDNGTTENSNKLSSSFTSNNINS